MFDCLPNPKIFLQRLHPFRSQSQSWRVARGVNEKFVLPHRQEKNRPSGQRRSRGAAGRTQRRRKDRLGRSQRVARRDGLLESGLPQLRRFRVSATTQVISHHFACVRELIDVCIISLFGRMLECYNHLKDTLTQQGYDQALKTVDDLPASTPSQTLLKTNLYCFLTIHCEYENSRCLTILQ